MLKKLFADLKTLVSRGKTQKKWLDTYIESNPDTQQKILVARKFVASSVQEGAMAESKKTPALSCRELKINQPDVPSGF